MKKPACRTSRPIWRYSLIAMACLPMSAWAQTIDTEIAEQTSSPKQQHLSKAYTWLNSQVEKRFSLQLATINGFERCNQEATKAVQVFCFESSSVPDRWFTLTGRYVSEQAAIDAAHEQGISGYMVAYIPRVLKTRCEMPSLDSQYRSYCGEELAGILPNDTKLVANAEPGVLTVEQGKSEAQSAVEEGKDNTLPTPEETRVAPVMTAQSSEGIACAPSTVQRSRPRRRPNYPVLVFETEACDADRLAPPYAGRLPDAVAVPDRWRIVDSLGYPENLWDPYNNNNPLKGDKPVFGKEWFFNLSAISDTVVEPRRFPVPVGAATTGSAGALDLVAQGEQYLLNENLIVEAVVYKGDTVFRPPDHEFRLITVFNLNHTVADEVGLLKADPAQGDTRTEGYVGIQGAFWDYHIRNVSDRYDFDSFRIGIQPFSSDFRGFLFQDNQFGVRLFGTRDNNIFQYNVAWFRRLEKESNSGLNDITDDLRKDDIFIANLYWQDFPRKGFISQASVIHNRNRESGDFFFDDNQFIARPSSLGFERGRDYDITYLGLSGDGHFGRNNLTFSAYYALGDQSNGVFINEKTDVSAYFVAAEASRDYDWIRARASFLHSSGDDNPFDTDENGFDAIFENPQFAGADTSFFTRQNVPLIGGGRVALNGRNSIIPSLRSSKEHGQSNFTNPGITLLGVGADFDITPQTRLSFNINQLWFDNTSSLELARNQTNIDKNIGQDISAAMIWRPLATQNIVFRLSGAMLNPGSSFKDLYGDTKPYSVLANLILAY